MTDEDTAGAFATLGAYRDGGGHYAENSEWKRYPADEIVMVLEGRPLSSSLKKAEKFLIYSTRAQ